MMRVRAGRPFSHHRFQKRIKRKPTARSDFAAPSIAAKWLLLSRQLGHITDDDASGELHCLRDRPFVIGREKNLQSFFAMACVHVEGKNTEAILQAHIEIVQPR